MHFYDISDQQTVFFSAARRPFFSVLCTEPNWDTSTQNSSGCASGAAEAVRKTVAQPRSTAAQPGCMPVQHLRASGGSCGAQNRTETRETIDDNGIRIVRANELTFRKISYTLGLF